MKQPHHSQARRRSDRGLAFEVLEHRLARRDLRIAIVGGPRRSKPLERRVQRGLSLCPIARGAQRDGCVALHEARDAEPLGTGSSHGRTAEILDLKERRLERRIVTAGRHHPGDRRGERDLTTWVDVVELVERIAHRVGAVPCVEREPEPLGGGGELVLLTTARCELERPASRFGVVGLGCAQRPRRVQPQGSGAQEKHSC